jgi:hypothetical protein
MRNLGFRTYGVGLRGHQGVGLRTCTLGLGFKVKDSGLVIRGLSFLGLRT